MRITTRWGEPPPEIEELESLELAGRAPGGAALRRATCGCSARVAAAEAEVSLAPGIENALGWLGGKPDAGAVPPAELDLVEEPGGARLRVDAIWDEEPERAFHEQELALLRRHARASRPPPPSCRQARGRRRRSRAFVRIHRVACTPAAARLVEGAVAPTPTPSA